MTGWFDMEWPNLISNNNDNINNETLKTKESMEQNSREMVKRFFISEVSKLYDALISLTETFS